jgi:signal transduction histidine kinase/DNA-binding response OmpR family regulator
MKKPMVPASRPFRFKRISIRILSIFVSVVAASIGLSGALVLQVSQHVLTKKISEADLRLAGRIGQIAEISASSTGPALAVLADALGRHFGDRAQLKADIDSVARGYPIFSRIYLAGPSGDLIYRAGVAASGNTGAFLAFREAERGNSHLSDVYQDPSTMRPTRTTTLPIERGGAVLGVLSADMRFEGMALPVEATADSPETTILVVSGNGRLVAHTRIGEVQDEDLSGLPSVEAVLAGRSGSISGYADELGRKVLGSYAPIASLGWGVVIQRPLSEIAAELRSLRLTLLSCLVLSILLATAAGYLMASRIARPVRRLADAASAVSRGDLSVSVASDSSDELGALAFSFNGMVASLRMSRDELRRWGEELEELVRQRTADLEGKTEELARANVGLQELSRIKSDFLANMSHEIRTPMNAVIGFAKLALRTALDVQQRDYVAKIHDAAVSLLSIINDILDFSKIEAGRLKMETVDFSLDRVVDAVISLTGQAADAKGLELLLDISPGLPRGLSGDPHRLQQILVNLIGNSVKFTAKGEIELGIELLEQVGEKVKLSFSVRDTGIGMTEEQLTRVFQPFSQADSSTTRKYGGTGLGLSIVTRLVQMMGGQIWAESGFGSGSTFRFTAWFGIGAEPQDGPIAAPPRLVGMRVLVADDNPAARESLSAILESLRFRVEAVDSGEEAIGAVERAEEDDPFGLVLLDWKMPGLDGIESARRIARGRIVREPPPILVFSASGGGEGERERAIEAGAVGFFAKPITGSTLFDTIVRVFAPEILKDVRKGAEASESAIGLAGARVLLAEDNEMNQQIAVELLRSAGVDVAVASDGREAVERLAAEGPGFDMVLMDIQMPEMDGYEATRLIRRDDRFSDLPVIAMTAHALAEAQAKAKEAGMNDYIIKPIDPDAMFAVLRKYYKPSEARGPDEAPRSPGERPRGGDAPIIPGIDTAGALRRVVGNRKLYIDLLRRYREGQGDAVDRIREALAAGDLRLAGRLAHTLKGVSGNIGAAGVQAIAGEAEAAIGHGPGPGPAEAAIGAGGAGAVTEEMLERLSGALGAVIAGISSVLASPEAAAADAPAWNGDGIGEIVAKLTRFAEESDGEAGDYFASARGRMLGAFGHDDVDRLESALRAYDFTAALEVLKRLSARSDGPMQGAKNGNG